MRIGIIGSNSGLANRYIKYLMSKNVEVVCYDIHDESLSNECNYHKIDFSNYNEILKIDFTCDYIFIFTGLTGPENSMQEYDSFINVNIKILLDILNVIVEGRFSCKVVYPSSRLVYQEKIGLLDEESPLKSKSIYGLTKIFAEQILELYHQNYNICYTIFRIGIPFDSLSNFGNSNFGIFTKLLKQAYSGEVILYGDGRGKRTFTHIDDICEVFYKSLFVDKTDNQVFNICGFTYSLLEIATFLSEITNCGISFVDWPINSQKVDVCNGSFSCDKINKIIDQSYINIKDVIFNYD